MLHNDYLAAGQNYGHDRSCAVHRRHVPRSVANAFVTGSATQNYYYSWINQNGLSDEDNLNLMDRQRISGTNKCYYGYRLQYVLPVAGRRLAYLD